MILLLVYMIIKHGKRRKLIFKDIILNEHGSEHKLKHLLSILARKNATRQTDN